MTDAPVELTAPVAPPDEPYPIMHIGEGLGAQPTVNQTIVLCMREIGAVAKNRQNVSQKYSFRGIDDFLNACHHVMAKHGLTIVPASMSHDLHVRERQMDGGRTGVTIHVINKVRWEAEGPAGDKKYFETIGEAADTADKATNKSISAAEKYMLISVFKIPTEDIGEGDSEHPDMGGTQTGGGGGGGTRASRAPKPPAAPAAPKVEMPTSTELANLTGLLEEVIGKTEVAKIKAFIRAASDGEKDRRTQLNKEEAVRVIDKLGKIRNGDLLVSWREDGAAVIYKAGEEPF